MFFGRVSFVLTSPSLYPFACYHLESMYGEKGRERERKRGRCQMPGPSLTPKTFTAAINQKKKVWDDFKAE